MSNVPFEPRAGDTVKPKWWSAFGVLVDSGDSFSRLRLTTFNSIYKTLAVKVKVTGRVPVQSGYLEGAYRCQVTFLGDGGPDVIAGGYIYNNSEVS